MTPRPFWKRSIAIEIAGLSISQPKIEIDVRRKVDGEPPSGTVLIHNLSRDTQQQIKEKNVPVVVNAGYVGHEAVIFTGVTQKVERDRANLSGLTRLTLTGMAFRDEDTPVTAKSWQNTDLHTLIASYCDDIGLNLGTLAEVPNEAIDYWYSSEPSADGLTRLLDANGMSWYEENDFLRINQTSIAQAQAGVIILSPQTGLIDRPSETDQGARARALLLPQVQLGSQIQLESDFMSGLWKVVALEHRGTNWAPGPFFTDMELREI